MLDGKMVPDVPGVQKFWASRCRDSHLETRLPCFDRLRGRESFSGFLPFSVLDRHGFRSGSHEYESPMGSVGVFTLSGHKVLLLNNP